MSMQHENIWQTLLQAGLVEGEEPESELLDSPWYIKLLLAISGWLASLFLLGFLALGFEVIFDSAGASLVVGSMMIAGAYALLKRPKNEFYEHVALAVSFAGQALVIWTIFDNVAEDSVWFLIFIFQLALSIFMPNFIHRVISSFSTVSSLFMTTMFSGLPSFNESIVMFLMAFIWLHEFNYPKKMQMLRAIGYGLTLGLIFIDSSSIAYMGLGFLNSSYTEPLFIIPLWFGQAITAAILLYVVWQLLKKQKFALSSPVSIVALLATIIMVIISMKMPGLIDILIIILGFSASNRVLMGLGIASLVFDISRYYYFLDMTLLEKSESLLIVGVALFSIYWLIRKFFPANDIQARKELQNG